MRRKRIIHVKEKQRIRENKASVAVSHLRVTRVFAITNTVQ